MYHSRDSFRYRFFVKMFTVSLATAVAAGAFAAEVTENRGDLTVGGLRNVVSQAADGETITFAPGIDSISLAGAAMSDSGNLTFAGNGRQEFQASLEPVFTYFLDAPGNFLWSDFFDNNIEDLTLFDWKDYGTDLKAALEAVQRPYPVLDGSLLPNGERMLYISATDGLSRVRGLVLSDATTVMRMPIWEFPVDTGPEIVTRNVDEIAGGAAKFAAGGFFDSALVSNNAIDVTGGTVRGGTATEMAVTVIETRTLGGAAIMTHGGASQSIFSGNSATAQGATVVGGTVSGADGTTLETGVSVTSGGGALYMSGSGTESSGFSNAVFQANTVKAVGGSISGGTSIGNALTAWSGSDVTSTGGAVVMENGGISNSIFQGNLVDVTGGKTLGSSAAASIATESIYAAGGAVSVSTPHLTVTNTVFDNNTTQVTLGSVKGGMANGDTGAGANASLRGSAYGGALAGGMGTVSGSVFHENTLSMQNGTVMGGTSNNASAVDAGADAEGSMHAGGGALTLYGSIVESFFEANTIRLLGGSAEGGSAVAAEYASATARFDISASGGAVAMSAGTPIGTGVSKSVFLNNGITVTGGSAQGGTVTNSGAGDFVGAADAFAETVAQGGAASAVGNVSESFFTGNFVDVQGGTAIAGEVLNSGSDLECRASAYALGMGGALTLFSRHAQLSKSVLTGNRVSVKGGVKAESDFTGLGGNSIGWAAADAYAFGGAAAFEGDWNTITDSTITYNSVEAVADGTVVQGGTTVSPLAYALGGAVFVGVNGHSFGPPVLPDGPPETTVLNLVATNKNRTMIAYNKANGAASGIHFGSGRFNNETGYLASSVGGAALNINTNKTGQVHLLDPVTVCLYNPAADFNSAFEMNVDGAGNFVWGGKNVFDANGGSTVNLNSGAITLGKDLSVGATANVDYRTGSATDAYAAASTTAPGTNLNDLVVNIDKDTTLRIDVTRSTGLAAFDFTGATNAKASDIFNVEKGAVLTVETEHTRRILDLEDTFLIADGLGGDDIAAALDSLVKGTGVTSINASNGKIFAVVDYESPIMKKLRSNNNSYRAATALNALVSDYDLISEKQFNAIRNNPWAITPEYALTQMHFTTRVLGSIADMAQQDYFDRYEVLRSRVDESYGVYRGLARRKPFFLKRHGSPLRQPRLWGGYVGDFSSMHRHAGYEAFKMYTDGILVGGDAKIDRCTSLGAYCAYLDETTRFRSINSGASSNGLQVGVMARRQMPRGWTWHGDLGYAYFDSDGYRVLSPFLTRSNFHQHAATIGLGFEYDILCGPSRFRPFLRNRYVYADQSGMKEYGDSGTETTVSGFDGNSFTTNFGFEMARRFAWSRLIFAPRLSLSWEHEFLDKNFTTRGYYNGIGSVESFRLSSAHGDRDRFILGTDMRLSFPGFRGRCCSGVIAYDYIVSGNTKSHTATIGMETRF